MRGHDCGVFEVKGAYCVTIVIARGISKMSVGQGTCFRRDRL